MLALDALVIGLALAGPQPGEYLRVLAIIAASGAALGAQVSPAIAFLIWMLAVSDIILVSYLAAPAKTQAALRLQHDWVSAHRRQLLIAVFTVDGFASLAHGIRRI
jgi:hypothetical protein